MTPNPSLPLILRTLRSRGRAFNSPTRFASSGRAFALFPLVVAFALAGCGQTAISLGVDDTPAPLAQTDTLRGRLMVGYQGWFGSPGDGAQFGPQYIHWTRDFAAPRADNVTFDVWPELDELDPAAQADTELSYADGRPARVFSSYHPATTELHARWMREYEIDGPLLQRFLAPLQPGVPAGELYRDHKDGVALNLLAASERHGRAFILMYDISGAREATLVEDLLADWRHVVDDLGLTDSDRYLRHEGRPVLGLWGLGVPDRPGTAGQAHAILDYLTRDAPERYRANILGGMVWGWRDGRNSKAGFTDVYRRYSAISPWSVNAYSSDAEVEGYARRESEPDVRAAHAQGHLYMPTVFPGFSWNNLMGAGHPLNATPRRGGQLMWRQFHEQVRAGADAIFVAMFDEIDEGTAIMKAAPHAGAIPAQGRFVHLGIDGHNLPSDWYLRVTREGGRLLRGQRSGTPTLPITPDTPPPNPTPTPTPTGPTGPTGPSAPGPTSPSTPALSRQEIIVTHAYRGILGRQPDPSGLAAYSEHLRNGKSTLWLCEVLYGSGEYATNRAPLDPTVLVEQLYLGILERAVDPSGLAASLTALSNGQGPARARDMLDSSEFAGKFL